MPITTASIQIMPYAVDTRFVAFANHPPPVLPAPGPGLAAPLYAGGVRYRGVHILYPLAACRFARVVNPVTVHDAREHVVFGLNANPAGDTYYLHYEDDHISSVRLPCPAPAGVDLFVTDNMSGCKFFVDTINGSTDLVVYHANTHLHGPGALADCDVQTGAADTFLNNMRTNAAAEYNPEVLVNAASCAKPTYCGPAGLAERNYTLLGFRATNPRAPNQNAGFVGGTTIFGFPAAGTWEFWYQTWGDYDRQMPAWLEVRPWYQRNIQHPATQVHPVSNSTVAIVNFARFH